MLLKKSNHSIDELYSVLNSLVAHNQCVRDAGLQTVSLFMIAFGSQSDGLSCWLDVRNRVQQLTLGAELMARVGGDCCFHILGELVEKAVSTVKKHGSSV